MIIAILPPGYNKYRSCIRIIAAPAAFLQRGPPKGQVKQTNLTLIKSFNSRGGLDKFDRQNGSAAPLVSDPDPVAHAVAGMNNDGLAGAQAMNQFREFVARPSNRDGR